MSKKYAYILLLVSVGLIAINLGVGTISQIKIPNTPINIPGEYIWGLWLFLFIPYVNEIRQSGINLKCDIKKEFNAQLCSWSRKLKDIVHPEMYTPLIDVSKIDGQLITWRCKYHQAGKNPEPSFVVISGAVSTIKFLFISCVKVLFKFEVLDRITLPVLGVMCVLSTKAYALWKIL